MTFVRWARWWNETTSGKSPGGWRETICPHCPVGCQLNLELNDAGEMIRVVPEYNSPANRGQACFKGKFGLQFINSRERLEQPLIRRDGALVEATWDEALDYVAGRLADYKGEAFALLASPNGTNEELYLAQKFARVAMSSNNVDVTSNLQPEATLALERGLGYGAATNPIWDLAKANCILVFNSNLTEDNNVVGLPIKSATKEGASLVVIDTREVELTRHANLWLRPAPGSESLLLGGILKEILEQGLDKKGLGRRALRRPGYPLLLPEQPGPGGSGCRYPSAGREDSRGSSALRASRPGRHLLCPG